MVHFVPKIAKISVWGRWGINDFAHNASEYFYTRVSIGTSETTPYYAHLVVSYIF